MKGKMTVKEFLEAGHKFVDGDSYINHQGRNCTVGNHGFGALACNGISNIVEPDKSHIISAKALDELVEWDGEGLPPVGVECKITNPHNYSVFDAHSHYIGNKGIVRAIFKTTNGTDIASIQHNDGNCICWRVSMLVALETPQQREDRERLEAAYDLYVCGLSAVNTTYCNFDDFVADYSDVYLAIVDKTGYRKND